MCNNGREKRKKEKGEEHDGTATSCVCTRTRERTLARNMAGSGGSRTLLSPRRARSLSARACIYMCVHSVDMYAPGRARKYVTRITVYDPGFTVSFLPLSVHLFLSFLSHSCARALAFFVSYKSRVIVKHLSKFAPVSAVVSARLRYRARGHRLSHLLLLLLHDRVSVARSSWFGENCRTDWQAATATATAR